MNHYSVDPLHVLRHEVSRLRDVLARIFEQAALSTDCESCTQIGDLERSLNPSPSPDDWAA